MDNELLQAITQIVKAETQPINSKLDHIEREVAKTFVIIENEICSNIKLLAEGHMGIIGRLDRIESKMDEIDDIKDSVSVLKAFAIRNK